jgi:lipoprotein-releasing system permease protein
VLGTELASDLGASIGDKVRIQSTEGEEQLFEIVGLVDLGSRQVNQRWALVSLRNGQTLLGIPGGATTLYATVSDIYDAESAARRVRELTALEARSWMEQNAQLLTALRSQSASTAMIRFFVVLAVAIGITSVLVVSVVQRSREIGILRAMGMSARTVQAVFLVQGGLMGLLGSIVGSAIGGGLALGFAHFAPSPGGEALFPIQLDAGLFASAAAIATFTGVLAALFPATRAARLDPAEAMLHV